MCEKCIQMELDGKSFFCRDCGNDVTIHGIAEWFMVDDEVWEKSGADKEDDLCVGCLEKLLGRKLAPEDFGGSSGFFPVNDLYEHSPRLRDRLGIEREKESVDGLIAKVLMSAAKMALERKLKRPRPGYRFDESDGYGNEEAKSC